MKNIHLIPTDKPSRLHLGDSGLVLCDLNFGRNTINGQNIYITSDEEIKEGDWFIDGNNSIGQSYRLSHVQFANPKKIILTTDHDLIEDGVQAIDDEFLEWFVKNPSCEYVEVTPPIFSQENAELINYSCPKGYLDYKIIIPQEEPKPIHQQIIDIVGGEDRFKEIAGLKPKQETLEEAAEKYLQEWRLVNNIHLSNVIHAERCKNDFIAGAKWQAERMYGEEEVLKLLYELHLIHNLDSDMTFMKVDEWFEQFKNK
jgi:hypothetical protein